MTRSPTLFNSQLVVLLFAQLCFGFAFSCFFLLPKWLTVVHEADPRTIGAIMATMSVAAVLGVPFIGAALDRYGRRPFITIGAVLCAVVAAGFTWVDEIGPLLYALRFLHGIGFMLAFNAAGTHVVDVTPPERHGQAIGLFGVTLLSMNAAAPAICEPLADAYGWDRVFQLAAAVGGLGALFTLLLRGGVRRDESPTPPWSTLLDRRLIRIFVVIGITGAAFGSLITFYQPYALELGMTEVRDFFIGYTVLAVGVRVGFGQLGDRVGRLRVSVVSLSLYAGAVLAMTWLAPGRLLMLGAALGFAHGIFYPTFNALALEGAPDAARGRIMTVFNGSFNVGFGSAVVLLGELAAREGYPTVFVTVSLLTFAGVGWLVLDRSGQAASMPAS